MEIEKYYEILAKKLDTSLQGLSKVGTQGNISKNWMEYLHILVDPENVQFLVELEVFPNVMTVRKFAKRINKSEEEASRIIERLFKNNCLMVIGSKIKKYAIHLPFLLFDVPPLSYEEYPKEKAKKLAELSLKYLVDDEWYRNFEGSPETPLSRIIPVQESIDATKKILPFEDVFELIENAEVIGIQLCACRKRLDYLGIRKCKYPLESCIGLNDGARYLIERGHAREISKEEAKKVLKELNKMGLVHTTENFQEGKHSLICSCCKCCCSLISGITRWDNPRAVAASNFIVQTSNLENCAKCETCIEKCNFNALQMGDDGPIVNEKKCMGCGICVVNCPQKVLELVRVDREIIYKNLIELGMKVLKETNKNL